ncbi:MAG: C39 family peptidase [Thermomicrobiales bacterium]|nr:C39 family peptidase [Thermomicrobiales bacterium]
MRRHAVLLGAMVMAAPLAALTGGGAPVAAADEAPVQAWLTVASETPAPGCWVDASLEVRRDGNPTPDVEAAVAFVVDGKVQYVDSGITGSDGFAFLGFDTSSGYIGADARFDVLIGGEYAGGAPLQMIDGGGCDGNAGVHELWGVAPIGSHSADDGWTSDDGGEVVALWVPTYAQQRGLSCEYASLSIAMSAYGTDISEYAFDDIVGWSDNPHWGYRGTITGTWGGTDDYGVYAEPLAKAAEAYGFWADVFYAQGDASQLTRRLDQGAPVLVWLGMFGDTSFTAYADDGTPYTLTPGQHTMVAYGYDDNGVYLSDPGSGAKRFYDWGWFMSMWNVLDGMSMSVGPN